MGPTSGNLPSGLDRADGLDGRVGTPTPDAAIQTATQDGVTPGTGESIIPIEEDPSSPTIDRGEQGTIVQRFTMSYNEGLNQIAALSRGTVEVDSNGNVTKIMSSSLQHVKPDSCIIIKTSESLSFDTPPDVFSITPVELGINIIKYPRYFYALNPTASTDASWATNILLNQDVIRCLQNYFENTTAAYRNTLTFQLQSSFGYPGTIGGGGTITYPTPITVTLPDGAVAYIVPIAGTDLAKAAAIEIIQKYWRNEETPYIVGYEMKWTSFTYGAPYLCAGGFIEDPLHESITPVPDYFWAPLQAADGSYQYPATYFPGGARTIFDGLSTQNPQCFSANGQPGGEVVISWLRKADVQTEQRTWWQTDRIWFGTPIGFWDADLYNSTGRPQTSTDYNTGATTIIMKGDITNANIPQVSLTAITL